VPSDAATVNGVAISQSQLDSDVTAVANDTLYACFLNAEQVVAGGAALPSLAGAGESAAGGPHTTANTGFVSTYLDTEIGHELVLQLAARHHLVISASDLATAKSELDDQITSVIQDVSGTQYACGSSTASITGSQVLSAMPHSFVDNLVRFDATISDLEEYLSGVGTSVSDLQGYYQSHRSEFDTACFTVAEYSSISDAQAAITKVDSGTPFATVAAQVAGGGPQGCDILYGISSELPAANLQNLALNALSAPVAESNAYLVIQITSRTTTPFETAKSEVQTAVRSAGSDAARTVIDAAEQHGAISVDPRYGKWVAANAQIVVPPSPATIDLLNQAADSASTPAASTPAATTPSSGQSG
jgi:hypothetical protein